MYYADKGLKKNLHNQWHGPSRCLGKDEFGYWHIHDGIALLSSPNFLRFATLNELEQAKINQTEHALLGPRTDLRRRSPAGQHGFIDLRNVQPPAEWQIQGGPDGPLEASEEQAHEGGMSTGAGPPAAFGQLDSEGEDLPSDLPDLEEQEPPNASGEHVGSQMKEDGGPEIIGTNKLMLLGQRSK